MNALLHYSASKLIFIHQYFRGKKTRATSLSIVALLAVTHASASSNRQDLADLSLEQLAALRVTTVTRTEKPLSKAPAAIFVITEQDVRRAGSTSLPEALRLAPNLQVARVDARNYAITARGFNNPFANKLLVMIDGRTVYSPLFSGTYWDAQDIVLEDLKRIEVVSGPGGSQWGANAVNGVVNIISRSAADTQGGLISLGASENEQHAAVRYGDRFAGGGAYRVYAKHSQHDDTLNALGNNTYTGWARTQTGFRADWESEGDNLTVHGDAYSGRLHQFATEDIEIGGANVVVRTSRRISSDSKVTLKAYIDHVQRDQPLAFSQHQNTFDLELQHECVIGERHKVMFGGGYRYINDNITSAENFAFLPADETLQWRNVFAQDQIALMPHVQLNLGFKWEENPFTDWESLPSAQLAWTVNSKHLLWGSVSRAVRSPSRIDHDFYSPSNPPVVDGVAQYVIAGGPDFTSEIAEVYELGYRAQPIPRISMSLTAFYSEYDRLRTLELNTDGPGFVFRNMAAGDSHGIELWGSWQVAAPWRLHAGVVAQEFDVYLKPGSTDISNTTALANSDPHLYSSLRSSYDISNNVKLDATLRHVDELKTTSTPAYTTMDLRLAWQLSHYLEFSLVGQNLLEDKHPEFGAAPGHSEYERAVYGKLIWDL